MSTTTFDDLVFNVKADQPNASPSVLLGRLKQYVTDRLFYVGPQVQREPSTKDLSRLLKAGLIKQWPVVEVEDLQALYNLAKVPAEHVYKCLDTGDLYLPHDGIFMHYNPYSTQVFRPILDDESFALPFGGELRSAMFYNILALHEDLRALEHYKIPMNTLLGKHTQRWMGYDLMTAFFLSNHSALADQVKQFTKLPKNQGHDLHREIESAFAKLGVSITHHQTHSVKFNAGTITFRSGDFVATF